MGKNSEFGKLDTLIKKHEELIPNVQKTAVMVDLYWKCYAYGDELKPHVEFLDGIMLFSTRDIAPSCVENVDELVERQEKSLVQLETKRKAQERLKLLQDTKEAWVGYAENNDTIVVEIEKSIALEDAFTDLAKRQDLLNKTRDSIMGLYNQIKHNVEVMGITLPDDKKKIIVKEMVALEEKLVVVGQFEEKVKVIDDFCTSLKAFDTSLKSMDDWMMGATHELEDIKSSSDKMAPEDRVARTMDLQEDIAAKIEVMKKNAEQELALLPQGEKVPADAQEFKDELARITKYVTDLANRTKEECDKYSEDVKFWAEYRTGIKEFTPWLVEAEKSSTEGLSKPANLAESRSLAEKVHTFDKSCIDHLKVLDAADSAAKKMTTHKEADDEVAALKARYLKVKTVADEWRQKVDTLVKEWELLDNTVTDLNAWVAKDKTTEGENQFSLEKMESTLGELKNIFKQKEKLVDNL